MMSRTNSWYEIKARAEGDAASPTEVFIFDEIGGWGTSAAQFVRDVKSITGPLCVRINSPGGSVFDAIAIHSYLTGRGDVETRVDGLAASAASVIFLAGTKRVMPESAFLMIHNPWTLVAGDGDEMRKQAGLLDQITNALVGLYAKATGLAADACKALMDAETWMDGKEAVANGFANEISDAAPVLASIAPGRFQRTPAALLPAEPAQPQGAAQSPSITEEIEKHMNKKLLALLGVKGTEREEFLASAITSLGVTEDGINAAQKDGKADFLAAHIEARIADADAKASTAIADRDKATATTSAILAVLGIKEPSDKLDEQVRAEIDARVSRNVAEKCAQLGIKPVPAEKQGEASASAKDIIEQFNSMKPGPERSAFFAKHRAVIAG